MSTRLAINAVMPLPDGTFMVRGTVVEGQPVVIGQQGHSTSLYALLNVVVVGVGVVDPNLDSTGRQGVLIKVTDGDASCLKGITLDFAPLA